MVISERRSVGYIDCVTRTAHYMDGFAKMYVRAIDRFMDEYDFLKGGENMLKYDELNKICGLNKKNPH